MLLSTTTIICSTRSGRYKPARSKLSYGSRGSEHEDKKRKKKKKKIRRLYTVPVEVLPSHQNLIHDSGRDRRTHPKVQGQNPVRFRARSSV
jgi:hypothetical protein